MSPVFREPIGVNIKALKFSLEKSELRPSNASSFDLEKLYNILSRFSFKNMPVQNQYN